jgi:hypothetical protein
MRFDEDVLTWEDIARYAVGAMTMLYVLSEAVAPRRQNGVILVTYGSCSDGRDVVVRMQQLFGRSWVLKRRWHYN